MLDFHNVSHMSDRDVQRMGHQDDVDPRDSAYSHRNLARRNPHGYRRSPVQRPVGQQYPVAWVWAAAVMATDANQGYVKETHNILDSNDAVIGQRVRNRDLIIQYLDNPALFTTEAVARGEAVLAQVRNDITFRALKGRLTDFDQAVSKVLAVEDQFDTAKHRYELAIVASLPASAQRAEKRATADERVKFATGGLIGQPGAKVSAQVEVLSAVFSQNYGCWFIKGITDRDQPVFFSYREGHDAGTWLTIQGTVKAHRDNLTQLNRVRVL